MKNPYRALEKKLGYRFRHKFLLEAALTHRSFRYEEDDIEEDNQRLEFLGDAVLGLVAANCLYNRHPDFQEGDLTKLRSSITNSRALVTVAKQIELGEHLRLGRGEEGSGGRKRASTLGDAMEAILGAAFDDGKIRAVEKIFNKLFVPLLDQVDEPWDENPKGALQEECQKKWKMSPRYELISESGPSHDRRFEVEVHLDGAALGRGAGKNKREAESVAARRVLTSLRSEKKPQD